MDTLTDVGLLLLVVFFGVPIAGVLVVGAALVWLRCIIYPIMNALDDLVLWRRHRRSITR